MMAGQLEDGFAAWVAGAARQGWRVEHAGPLARRLALLRHADPAASGWQGGGATLPGGMELAGGARCVLRVTLPRLDRLRGGDAGRAAAAPGRGGIALRRGPAGGAAAAGAECRRARRSARGRAAAARHPRRRCGGAPSVRLAVEPASPPSRAKPALQPARRRPRIDLPLPAGRRRAATLRPAACERWRLDLALSGPVPPGRGPAHAGGSLARWRRHAGGARRWRCAGGRCTAQRRRDLALDEALQPMGAGTLRLTGAVEALDAAAAAGLLPPRGAGHGAGGGAAAQPHPAGGRPAAARGAADPGGPDAGPGAYPAGRLGPGTGRHCRPPVRSARWRFGAGSGGATRGMLPP